MIENFEIWMLWLVKNVISVIFKIYMHSLLHALPLKPTSRIYIRQTRLHIVLNITIHSPFHAVTSVAPRLPPCNILSAGLDAHLRLLQQKLLPPCVSVKDFKRQTWQDWRARRGHIVVLREIDFGATPDTAMIRETHLPRKTHKENSPYITERMESRD